MILHHNQAWNSHLQCQTVHCFCEAIQRGKGSLSASKEKDSVANPSASFRVGFFLFHARATRPIFAALPLPSIFLRLIRFAQDAIVLLKLVIRRGKRDFFRESGVGNAPRINMEGTAETLLKLGFLCVERV